MKLHILGRTELVGRDAGGATPLRFLPERRFRLLAYVALRGDWVSRDELATLFWHDRTQEAARSNLRKLLQEVRALDVPGLETDRVAVRWRVATDAADFEAAVGRGDVPAAVALYRGSALQGLDGGESDGFRTWLGQERARLASTLRDAILSALPQRDPGDALALARRLLDEDPLDEDAVVAALNALLDVDDRRGARELFNGYVERLADDLGVEPSTRVRSIAARISAAHVPPAVDDASALSFFGRSDELRGLKARLLDPACRLLTVMGPGGIGKSRLVKHAVGEIAAGYPDGLAWIPLADLSEVADALLRILSELSLVPAPGQETIECIEGHLRGRRMLLVLDNFEHLPELSAPIGRLLAAASGLQVVSTSRSPVGIPGEDVLPLAGLSVPAANAGADSILACDAVRMFVAHARAADPRFDAARNAEQIGRLVRTADGLPLAILLAASWVRLMPMTEIAADVAQSLDVLERADEGEERAEHRSVRMTFEQSWRLLVPAEQRALAALSVFAGEFTRAAALAVSDTPLVVLSSLVDKSLVHVDVADGAGSRFHLHPLLRHFAAAKLVPDERLRSLSRHASHFAQWLADIAQDLRGANQPQALAALEQQLPDCRLAWSHALESLDASVVERATLPLMYYYEARGRRSDGIAVFAAAERAFDASPGAAAALANIARALSTLRYRSGEFALTIDTATRGIALARSVGARAALKGCLLNLGLSHYQRRQLDIARGCFEEALALAREDHDQSGIAAFVNSLAMVEQDVGAYDVAETYYRETLRVFRELGNPRGLLTAMNNLALLLLTQKRPQDALPLYEEGMQLCARHGIEVMRANFLFGLGGTRLALGQLPVARDLTQQALEAAEAGGEPHVAVESRMQLARIALKAGRNDEALRAAEEALTHATRDENLPVLLESVHCVAECRLAQGDARVAVALWLFIASHPEATDVERSHFGQRVADVSLPPADRSWAEDQAKRYELSSLAAALAPAVEARASTP